MFDAPPALNGNKKPFPKINSFVVTVQILQYVDIQDKVVELLYQLSHSTRAYVCEREDDLSQWLMTFPNNLSMREYANLGDKTRSFFSEIFNERANGNLSYGK